MSVQQRNVEFEVAGVNALLMRFGDQLDTQLPSFLSAFREYLLNTYGNVIESAIPAYTTMMVAYDPRQCRMYDLQQLLERALHEMQNQAAPQLRHSANLVQIPVIYD